MSSPRTHSALGTRMLNSLNKSEFHSANNPNFLGPNQLMKIGLPDCDNNLQMIEIADIVYCQSIGNTTSVFVDGIDLRFIVFDSLKSFEERLGRFNFFRTHRSFLINLNKVLRYNFRKDKGRKIKMVNNKIVSVSDDKKKILKNQLQLF